MGSSRGGEHALGHGPQHPASPGALGGRGEQHPGRAAVHLGDDAAGTVQPGAQGLRAHPALDEAVLGALLRGERVPAVGGVEGLDPGRVLGAERADVDGFVGGAHGHEGSPAPPAAPRMVVTTRVSAGRRGVDEKPKRVGGSTGASAPRSCPSQRAPMPTTSRTSVAP